MGGPSITTHSIAVHGRRSRIKICPSSAKECARILANEKNALLLAGRYVKTPSLLAYGKKKVGRAHHAYLLLESLRGAPFMPSRDWLSASEFLATLHSRTVAKPAGVGHADDAASHLIGLSAPLASLVRKSKASPSAKRQALSLFAAAKRSVRTTEKARHLCLCNGLPLPNNFAKTPHGIALSDWSHAVFSSPALDLCIFLSPFSLSWRSAANFTGEMRSAFLRHCLSRFPEGAQREIMRQCGRASLPASAYLFLLGLTSPSPPKHFRNILFVKKASAQARQPFSP